MVASSNGSQSILDALLTGRFLDDLIFPAKIHQNSTDSFRELLEAAAVGFSNPIPGDLDELIKCLEFNKNLTNRLTQMAISKIKPKLALVVMLCADDVAPGKFRSQTLRQYMLDTEKFTKNKDTLKQLLDVTELPNGMESLWYEFILPGVTPNEEPTTHGNAHEVAQSSTSAAIDADQSKRRRVDSLTEHVGDILLKLADGWTVSLVRAMLDQLLNMRREAMENPINYSFRNVGKSPETTIVDALICGSFIDKTQSYKKLFTEYQSIHNCWICGPRRFGKSTLLSTLRFILSPLPAIITSQPDKLKTAFQHLAGLTEGKFFLSLPVRPVVFLSFTCINNVKTLKNQIIDSFRNACFPASLSVSGNIDDMNCLEVFSGCWRALLSYWGKIFADKNSDVVLRPLILFDEFDFPWRMKVYESTSFQEVVTAITSFLPYIKSVLDDADIIVVTLLRIASIGISTLNTLQDVMISSEYHGIIGVTEQEFSHALMNSRCGETSFILICKYQYAKFWHSNRRNMKVKFWEWLRITYNGFRFAIDAPTSELYNPLDLLELCSTIFTALKDKRNLSNRELQNVKVIHTLPFPWLKDIPSSFVQVLSNRINRDVIISVLQGGVCTQDALVTRLPLTEYERMDYDMVQRLCYELGLLSVRVSDSDGIYLSPGFGAQYLQMLRSLGMIIHKDLVPASLTESEISDLLGNNAHLYKRIDSCMEITARTLVNSSAKFEKMREYAFQDCLYRTLLLYMCSNYIKINIERTIKCGEQKGRVDFLITMKRPPDLSPSAASRQVSLVSSSTIIMELKMICLDKPSEAVIKSKFSDAEKELLRYNKHNASKNFPVAVIGCWTASMFKIHTRWYEINQTAENVFRITHESTKAYPKAGTISRLSDTENAS